MMRAALRLIIRFRDDERGAFAVIFAVIAIVLIAMSGAAVDFSIVQEARTRAQTALDAAVLALQPGIYGTPAGTLQAQAQLLLVNRLADPATTWGNCNTNNNKAPCAYVLPPGVDTTNGQLSLQATLKIPMNFVSLVGVTTMSPTVVAVATRKKLKLEVALVLDGSDSMASAMGDSTRLETLQRSATCAANILFYGVSSCTASTAGLAIKSDIKMAIVPFAAAVNVGPGNADAAWLDRSGRNNVITLMHFDNNNGDSDIFKGPVDRIDLFGKIEYKNKALQWGGCVEARLNNGSDLQYDTDDTVPDPYKPVTLFTPYFAPDEPGDGTGTATLANGDVFHNTYIADECGTEVNAAAHRSEKTLQERLCKYNVTGGAVMVAPPNANRGPNAFCPTNPITPLTSAPRTISDAINALTTSWGTNIEEGIAWGFRVLSPTAPFEEGSAFGAATSKVMIMMTDGANSLSTSDANFNGGDYSAYGYPLDGRLGASTTDAGVLAALINDRMGRTCSNAKADGIIIYTIGIDPSAANRKLLTSCASQTGYAYFPHTAADLQAAFVSIATQLGALRLAR
jgi:Flp pilus assembly protein TadG